MTDNKNDPDSKEQLLTLQALVTYLLYEKQEETQIRNAFAALTQERHVRLHDEDTEFTSCANDLCIKALELLADAKSMTVELNAFGVQVIQNYNLKFVLSKETKLLKAWLVEKEGSTKPEQPATIQI